MWSSSTSGIKNKAAPIPLSFSVPANYTSTDSTDPTAPILLDQYTVRFRLQPPLVLPENCSCGLTQASFAYSQPNIAGAAVLESAPTGNNRLTMIYDGTSSDIVLADGLYDYIDVQAALNVYVRTHDASGAVSPPATAIVTGATDLFILTGIAATQKLVFSLNPAALPGGTFPTAGIDISFVNPSPNGGLSNSIGPILGYPVDGSADFTTPVLGDPDDNVIYSNYAPNVASFSDTSAYVLYMSLVTTSYQNGSAGQLLYSFPLGSAAPNSVVSYQATLRYPVPLNSGTFSSVDLWTADQAGNRLPWAAYQAPFQFSAIVSKNREDGSL